MNEHLRPGGIIQISQQQWYAMQQGLMGGMHQAQAHLQNAACAMQGNMLAYGPSIASARNASAEVRKADTARAYAAAVVARKPSMQVKKRGSA